MWRFPFRACSWNGRNALNFAQCCRSTLSVEPQSSCCVRNEYLEPIISPSKYVVRVGLSSVRPILYRPLLAGRGPFFGVCRISPYLECASSRIRKTLSYPRALSRLIHRRLDVRIAGCHGICFQGARMRMGKME
jgi:hypothetical protein